MTRIAVNAALDVVRRRPVHSSVPADAAAEGGDPTTDVLRRIRGAFLHTVRQILQEVEGAAVVISALVPVAALAGLGWLLVRRFRTRMV
jgi:hypothetical protein